MDSEPPGISWGDPFSVYKLFASPRGDRVNKWWILPPRVKAQTTGLAVRSAALSMSNFSTAASRGVGKRKGQLPSSFQESERESWV